jgi:hypothetical protein
MFFLWVKTIKTNNISDSTILPELSPNTNKMTKKTTEHTNVPTDARRSTTTIRGQQATATKAARGLTAKYKPKIVANPFPPLNL